MTNQHPITPPPELVLQWQTDWHHSKSSYVEIEVYIATKAARWGADQQLKLDAEQIAQAYQAGADQELEACCELLKADGYKGKAIDLRNARRPKPPTLKELALAALKDDDIDVYLIRRALEALPND
jgi:hypothetical protein